MSHQSCHAVAVKWRSNAQGFKHAPHSCLQAFKQLHGLWCSPHIGICSALLPRFQDFPFHSRHLVSGAPPDLQAFTSFAAALALDKHHVEGLVACGDLHMQWEQPGKAAAFFQRAAAQVSPHAAEANQKLAAALVSQGRGTPLLQVLTPLHSSSCRLPALGSTS